VHIVRDTAILRLYYIQQNAKCVSRPIYATFSYNSSIISADLNLIVKLRILDNFYSP